MGLIPAGVICEIMNDDGSMARLPDLVKFAQLHGLKIATIADLIDRLKIILLPLITLVYPLFKLIPPTYDWRMRSRINRWYRDLQAIEEQVKAREPNADLAPKLDELDRLEANVGRVSVPLAYANPLYTLRSHIALLRDELRQGREPRHHKEGNPKLWE